MQIVQNEFDIIVLGGGLVGLTTALLAAQNNFTVAIVEKNPPNLDFLINQDFDCRVSAITKASQQIFEKLNCWQDMQALRVNPFHRMEVWDALGTGKINFDASEVFEPLLGNIIENRVMLKVLWEKAAANPNIHIFSNALPKSLLQSNENNNEKRGLMDVQKDDPKNLRISLQLQDSQKLRASLVVGADGACSWLRNSAQLAIQTSDYHQTALVATVETEISPAGTAWQRFLPTGPLAFLPLNDRMSSIVWTSTLEDCQQSLAINDNEFCEKLGAAFDFRLGKILSVSPRKSFPLSMLYAKQMIADRIALVGDAAHVIHPLAGLGVNLGFYDAAYLVDVLKEAAIKQIDSGHRAVLRRYERARKSEALLMVGLMDFFKTVFAKETCPIITLRSFGMNRLNRMPWLKKKIIYKGMGL